VPGFAGAVLRGREAVAAITTGAVASPIGAIFALDDLCSMNMWAAVGLAAIAVYVLVIAGIAAFVGAWIGRANTVEYQPRRGVVVLVVVGAIGVLAWIAAVVRLNGCP
jgi:MFS-type transporter involved in bile tolerance (Atg22 family)